jgi:hypothetical protein
MCTCVKIQCLLIIAKVNDWSCFSTSMAPVWKLSWIKIPTTLKRSWLPCSSRIIRTEWYLHRHFTTLHCRVEKQNDDSCVLENLILNMCTLGHDSIKTILWEERYNRYSDMTRFPCVKDCQKKFWKSCHLDCSYVFGFGYVVIWTCLQTVLHNVTNISYLSLIFSVCYSPH